MKLTIEQRLELFLDKMGKALTLPDNIEEKLEAKIGSAFSTVKTALTPNPDSEFARIVSSTVGTIKAPFIPVEADEYKRSIVQSWMDEKLGVTKEQMDVRYAKIEHEIVVSKPVNPEDMNIFDRSTWKMDQWENNLNTRLDKLVASVNAW